jgi:hypothetical protein
VQKDVGKRRDAATPKRKERTKRRKNTRHSSLTLTAKNEREREGKKLSFLLLSTSNALDEGQERIQQDESKASNWY